MYTYKCGQGEMVGDVTLVWNHHIISGSSENYRGGFLRIIEVPRAKIKVVDDIITYKYQV